MIPLQISSALGSEFPSGPIVTHATPVKQHSCFAGTWLKKSMKQAPAARSILASPWNPASARSVFAKIGSTTDWR